MPVPTSTPTRDLSSFSYASGESCTNKNRHFARQSDYHLGPDADVAPYRSHTRYAGFPHLLVEASLLERFLRAH